ncbi:unnamed protein product [Brassica oleracea]
MDEYSSMKAAAEGKKLARSDLMDISVEGKILRFLQLISGML